MKPKTLLVTAAVIAFLALSATALWAGEKITPAHVYPQEQASALAVPTTDTSPPASVVLVTTCHEIVGVVVVDLEGSLHPMNLEGLSNTQVSRLITNIPQKLVVDTGCPADPNRQPIF